MTTPDEQANPQQPDPGAVDVAEQIRKLTAALQAERSSRIAAEQRLTERTAAAEAAMEKAVTEAREAGRVEGQNNALREAGQRIAGAEFRARSAGRVTDPTAAMALLDLTRFINDGGDIDCAAIDAAVETLATSIPAKALSVPAVPNGVRHESNSSSDWLRDAINSK